jgi:hypothetical protein
MMAMRKVVLRFLEVLMRRQQRDCDPGGELTLSASLGPFMPAPVGRARDARGSSRCEVCGGESGRTTVMRKDCRAISGGSGETTATRL